MKNCVVHLLEKRYALRSESTEKKFYSCVKEGGRPIGTGIVSMGYFCLHIRERVSWGKFEKI